MAGLFGSGPSSNILNTVAGSYNAMLNAEKQKGAATYEAMGAFGKAISPKAMGMNQFKNDFKGADWSSPETYARAGEQIMQFDPAAGLSMLDKGRSLAASMAPAPQEFIESEQVIDGILFKGAMNKATGEFTPYEGSTGTPEITPETDVDLEKRKFAQSGALRDELAGDLNYSEYKQSQLQFGKIKTSAKAESAAGDMSVIFAYMKMLDPESVVREGEQATAENARGVPDGIMNIYNKTTEGLKLTKKQREDFVSVARAILKENKDSAVETINRIKSVASNYDVPVEDVFGNVDKQYEISFAYEGVDKTNREAVADVFDTLSPENKEIVLDMISKGEF